MWLACLPLLALLGACATATPTVAPDEVSVQFNWVHSPEFAGFYVAQDLGFYAEENLNVELRARPEDRGAPEVLADGDADFAVFGVRQLQSMIDDGQQPVALAALYQISPRVFFALEESNIRHPRDMVGRKVGIKSAGWRNSVHSTLNQIGIDPEEIVEVEVGFNDIDKLYNGEVDVWTGFVLDEPVNARRDGYDVDLIFPADYAVGSYIGLITAMSDQFEANPELAERLVRASLRGWEYAIQNPDEAAKILARWDPEHDVDFHRAAIHELVPLIDTGQVPIGWIDEARWLRELDAGARARDYLNQDGVLSIPANRAWFSAVNE